MTLPLTLYVFWEHSSKATSWKVVSSSLDVMQLSLDDIRQKISEGTVISLVLPAKFFSIYQIKLPKLPQKDISSALMSILEDKVIEDLSNLWWFYQKAPSGLYQVVVCDKAWITDIHEFWKNQQIALNTITLDWFALKPQEILVMDNGDALLRSTTENGCFVYAWLSERLKNHIEHFQIYDSYQVKQPFEVWVVQRFLQHGTTDMNSYARRWNGLNLFDREKMLSDLPKFFWGSVSLITLVWILVFSKNTWMYFQNLKEFKTFSSQSSTNLENNLARYQKQEAQKKQFWSIWIALQKAYPAQIHLQQLKYDQNQMQLFFDMKSVGSLQEFKSRLLRQKIKILQSKVQSMPNGVNVVLTIKGRT